MAVPSLHIQPGNPDFLDLPWDRPVGEWDHERLVDMPAGIHRHPVVFVAYAEGVYAIKEMPSRLAANEYRVLRALRKVTNRVVEPAGFVERGWLDPQSESAAAVVTRYVRHAFPYRNLLAGPGFGPRRNQMLDAVAGLLVEIHLAGCYWGDCSLSNLLYRYDAGAIEAIMVDAETSEIHDSLSDGQRVADLEIMKENLAGEMSDIAAMGGVAVDDADLALGEDVEGRYRALWAELTQELVIGRDERYRIRERIGRLNELGFSVDDIDLDPVEGGELVKMRTRVGGRTFNSDRLREMTGIEASENQARVILGDLSYYLAKHDQTSGTAKSVGTFRWLSDWFEPMRDRIEEEWPGDDPIQGYCDFLHHRMELASKRGADVPNEEAFESWVAKGFPGFPI
ncbi:MAG TPA: DUF4032 domain-containing protein [Acidimicrobiia bacterium]|nr:DUF4032 domain-containing protein [Acidimicrobiia bacterium]